MAIAPGTRLGIFEITAPLGAGGMGEVYRARDAKLGRDVAIKVLPAGLAGDAEYLARFEREAQVLDALNHPNIAAIYGLEQSAIMMEWVEGETLRGPRPLAEALAIARQIAEAREAAHENGIVHRDLKPGKTITTSTKAISRRMGDGLRILRTKPAAAKCISGRFRRSQAACPVSRGSGRFPRMVDCRCAGATMVKSWFMRNRRAA